VKRFLAKSPALRRLYYKQSLKIDLPRFRVGSDLMKEVSAANRKVLSSVDNWIDDYTYEHSVFGYGLPQSIRPYINDQIDLRPSYSDLLVCLGKGVTGKLRYLELGPSVGKNLLQMLSGTCDGELTAVDIEDVNPALSRRLRMVSVEEWPGMEGSKRIQCGRRTEFEFVPNRNRLSYIAGDLFDPATWQQLRGRTFNLVFSDAFHSGEALRMEWKYISELELLDREGFTMVWDDLTSAEMRNAFEAIVAAMKEKYQPGSVSAHLEFFQGWVGRRAPLHPIGIARLVPKSG